MKLLDLWNRLTGAVPLHSYVRVSPDVDSLCRALAEYFVSACRTTLSRQKYFSVVLSGGQTPRRFYETLAQEPHRSELPWERIHFFWSDERFVPRDHADSNYRMAQDALLSKVGLIPAHVHPVNTALPSLQDSADDYEKRLRIYFSGQEWPSFDLIFLGVGEDGHVASLFPGDPVLSESRRWVVPVFAAPKPPPGRVTLTLPVINSAHRVSFMVSGSGKEEVVRKMFRGEMKKSPALNICPKSGTLLWWLDPDAAVGLRK